MEVNFLKKSNIQPNMSLLFNEQRGHSGEKMRVNKLEYNNRPTNDISFRGSAVLKAQKILKNATSEVSEKVPKFFKAISSTIPRKVPETAENIKIPEYAKKLVKNDKFANIIEKVLEKEAVVEAAIVLGLTTTIKPLCTLIMPGASKDDKEVLATKHALSGLVGYGFSKIFYSPISKGANKVANDPYKYLKGDTDFIKKIEKGGKVHECFDVVWKKGPDVIMSIPKSIVTVALITPALALLFPNHKKNQKNQPSQDKKSSDVINQKISTDKKLTFKGRQDNNEISFTGKFSAAKQLIENTPVWKKSAKIYDKFTDLLATGIGKLSITKPVKKIVEALTKREKPAPILSHLASIVLTLSLLNNTAKSKKIEKERKPYLLLNTALVTAVSSTASIIIDFCSDGVLESIKKAYMAEKFGLNKENIVKGLKQLSDLKEFGEVQDAAYEVLTHDNVKQLNRYMRGVNKLKSHTIFSFIVRFASPLLVVPLTTKILDMVAKHKKKKSETQTAQVTPQAQQVQPK